MIWLKTLLAVLVPTDEKPQKDLVKRLLFTRLYNTGADGVELFATNGNKAD